MTVTFSKLGKHGRLGNQLFQIASTIGIAKRTFQDFIFPKWEYSEYFENKLPTGWVEPDATIFEMAPYYTEYAYTLEPIKDYDLFGYFQSYRYFEECQDLIKYYFTPNFNTNTVAKNSVAIHVRRGDYLNLANHPVLDMNYYNEAMSMFQNKTFYIFSNDIDWCKDNFDHSNSVFILPTVDIIDLFFMSKFDNIIIANSSFSWWAAYLGNGNKKVVAPKVYVSNEIHTKDRYLSDWIVV